MDDLVRGIFLLLENNPYGSEPVNIGYGTDVTIRRLAEIVAEKSGSCGELGWDETKPNGRMQRLMDVTRMRALGFYQEISLEAGLESWVRYYRGQFPGGLI